MDGATHGFVAVESFGEFGPLLVGCGRGGRKTAAGREIDWAENPNDKTTNNQDSTHPFFASGSLGTVPREDLLILFQGKKKNGGR